MEISALENHARENAGGNRLRTPWCIHASQGFCRHWWQMEFQVASFMLEHSEFRTEGIILYWLAKPGAPWSPQSICTPLAAPCHPATKGLTADPGPCHYCLPNILIVLALILSYYWTGKARLLPRGCTAIRWEIWSWNPGSKMPS